MTNTPQASRPDEVSKGKLLAWWGTIAGICLVIILGSTFVTRSYMHRRTYEMENWRPPYLAKLENDLELINRDGSTVHLGLLKGKVWVAGYNYTGCPAGCLGIAAIMKGLEEKFGHLSNFHLVSFSVDPVSDTPRKMDTWVKEKGVDSPNWWFLTGDEELIRKYMISQFKFYGTEENTDPATIQTQGKWAHDQRLAIVDGNGNVRGYYNVMSPEYGMDETERLYRDLEMVLNPELKLKDFQ